MPMMIKNYRLRAKKRGFTTLPSALEIAAIVGWFGVVMAGAKYMDSTITQRRAAEISAQDSIHASASPCQSLPANFNLGSVGATSNVNMANVDQLGLDSTMQCPASAVGVPNQQAYPALNTPLRHTTSNAVSTRLQAEDLPNGGTTQSVKTVLASRQLSCQDIPQAMPSPDPFIKQLSQQIWARNVMGY